MSYALRSFVALIAYPYPRQVGQTVLIHLLNIQISPSHGHKILSIGVVLNHVEMRTTALCILNHSPSIHCIQGAAVQTCGPGLCFQGLPEGLEESIVALHIIVLCSGFIRVVTWVGLPSKSVFEFSDKAIFQT